MGIRVIFFTFAYFAIIGIVTWMLRDFVLCIMHFVYDFIAPTLVAFLIAHFTFPFVKKKLFCKEVSPRNKAVLITGCDSGFGYYLAKRLDSKGFHVFAGCLFPIGFGAKSLQEKCSDSLHILRFDATKKSSTRKALKEVKENLNGSELWAVVNNAGIRVLRSSEIEQTQIQRFQAIMDFYTTSVIRSTKTFLPLLRRSQGRVITITSLADRTFIPCLSAYCMSKSATSCFCKCLRKELLPLGIKVITVEPKFFKMLIENRNMQNLDHFYTRDGEKTKEGNWMQYFLEYKTAREQALKLCNSEMQMVIDSLQDAVVLEEPSSVYRPGYNVISQLILKLEELLPKVLVDRLCSIFQISCTIHDIKTFK